MALVRARRGQAVVSGGGVLNIASRAALELGQYRDPATFHHNHYGIDFKNACQGDLSKIERLATRGSRRSSVKPNLVAAVGHEGETTIQTL